MISRRKLLRATALGAISSTALTALGRRAFAQNYPARPVRWVVPYPPGGATDIVARIVGAYLTESLGQQVIIENRPGAGNNLGTEAVVSAAPDGHTFLLVNPANAINATLYKKLSFNLPEGHDPGRRHHPRAERDGGESVGAGQDRRGVHRLRQGQSRQDQLGDVRQRHVGAPVGRTVQDDDRRRSAARAVSRFGARAHRHARRPGARDVRQHAAVAAAHQSRQAARARRDDGAALAGAARRADGRRNGRRATRRARSSGWPCPRARRQPSSRGSTAR